MNGTPKERQGSPSPSSRTGPESYWSAKDQWHATETALSLSLSLAIGLGVIGLGGPPSTANGLRFAEQEQCDDRMRNVNMEINSTSSNQNNNNNNNNNNKNGRFRPMKERKKREKGEERKTAR